MIQVEDDELTLTVADSLRSIGIAELDLPVGADVLSRLQALAHSGNVAKLIINQLLKQLEVKAYRNFLIEVLQATQDSNGDQRVVYPLLQANLDKLDNNFAQALRSWATATLSELEAEQTRRTAVAIGNFSNLIREFPKGHRASNLEIAITGYEVIATVFTHQAFPDQWATTQNNLGNAYCERIKGERAENIEVAIRCFSSALEEYTRQAFPEQWAVTQNNLGNAYLNRIKGERAENIEVAIRCFSSALEEYTRNTFPQDWAMSQNNLGAAYFNRIQGERAENLETAIYCFSAALEVRTREDFPEQWAATHNNLGNAYSNRMRGKRAENIEVAIRCFSSALEVRTCEDFPEQWAATHNNLGNAYLNRIHGNRAENLEVAIHCFSAALEVRTREAFPEDWADTQNNLGVAYLNRIHGNRAENLEAAIHCFSTALEVHTRQAFPQNHAKAQFNFNLGLAYRDAQQFSKAYSAFALAIDAVEFLRSEIVSGDEAKQKLAEEWNPLYQDTVEVCLELHDYTEAIKYVERSQARNLVELLAKPELYPEGSIPTEILNELDHLREEITHTPQLIDMEVERRRRGILTWKSA
ncbi:tetratricopeptide repeat protein [Microcoleus sp. FACHB-SPT15]|nr:tetratricopeptide repeat protein [Microcoleus sp. FACHB-SPT15]